MMKSSLPSVVLFAHLCALAGCSSQASNPDGVSPSTEPSNVDSAGSSAGQPITTGPAPSSLPSTTGLGSAQNPSNGTDPATTCSSAGGCLTDGPATSGVDTTSATDSSAPSDSSDAPAGGIGFSVPSGTFEGSLAVTITGGEGAELRYTTDGTLPTATSTLYDGSPLTLTETTQLRVIPFVAGVASGLAASAIYIRRTFDVSSDIPILIFEGYGKGKPPTQSGPEKVVWRDLGLMLFEPVDGVTTISQTPTWASRAGYHVRGQSSATFEKTPYRVELWDENNEDLDLPMIGMPADADWAMIGEYSDKTLVRNAFSFSLALEMGLEAPRMRFADVYINQDQGPLEASDYQGVYAVTETIKNKSTRFDYAQLKPKDTEEAKLSGGYIFKFDMGAVREDEGEVQLVCTSVEATCFEDVELKDPNEPNAEQLAWISDYVSRAHDALLAEPIGDYSQYLDVPSFVNLMVLNELTKGGDKYLRSVYLHKDRDELITAGPVWDFNFTLGNLVDGAEGWQVNSGRDDGKNWFRRLFAQPEVKSAMAARWKELRSTILSDAALEARIDEVAAPILTAGPRDLERWPVTGGGVFGGGFGGFGGMGGGTGEDSSATPLTWQGHIDEMKQWVRQRTVWLDAEYATF